MTIMIEVLRRVWGTQTLSQEALKPNYLQNDTELF